MVTPFLRFQRKINGSVHIKGVIILQAEVLSIRSTLGCICHNVVLIVCFGFLKCRCEHNFNKYAFVATFAGAFVTFTSSLLGDPAEIFIVKAISPDLCVVFSIRRCPFTLTAAGLPKDYEQFFISNCRWNAFELYVLNVTTLIIADVRAC
jgi:hypothetical protein